VTVADVIANVAALVVGTAICRLALQIRMLRAMQLGSLPGQTFQPQTRRSVQNICKELGEGYFRREYRIEYRTFKCLANALRKYIKDATAQVGCL
jgi:hypothetical protein